MRVQIQLEELVKKIVEKEDMHISQRHCKILPSQLNENVGDVAALIVAEMPYRKKYKD